MTDYNLFPGCVIPNRLPYLEDSARKTFEKLGIKTHDAPFNCCPDPVGFQSVHHKSWMALSARNLTIAEQDGRSIVSICNGCTQTLKMVNEELKHDDDAKEEMNAILKKIGREFKGSVEVKHFVQVLIEDVGVEKIAEQVTNPFTGMKVACHTGCHYSRPSSVMQWDDPMAPKFLRQLVEATGATAVDYDEEVLCCGAGVGNVEEEPAMHILKQKMDSAIAAGADCFVVVCPACFQQLDNNQRTLKKYFEKDYNIPILYLTELLALAFGHKYEELSLKLHRARPQALLEKYNAV